jgi:hypothetical protein
MDSNSLIFNHDNPLLKMQDQLLDSDDPFRDAFEDNGHEVFDISVFSEMIDW